MGKAKKDGLHPLYDGIHRITRRFCTILSFFDQSKLM